MLGTIGQLALLVAIVACLLAGLSFFQAANSESRDWRRIGRWSWGAMAGGVLLACGLLSFLFFTHKFQYAYVYQHSSVDLESYFLLSGFWAGQEGSFLLWILMNSVVGFALIRWTREYEAPVMAGVSFCQVFLLSMVLGLQLGPVEIGASPFLLLAEKFPEAPIFQANAGFVPADGPGLNDLLQNYWMVIHPPTLFVGFALMIVPFAYAVAALWKKKYTQWVRPAMPWAMLATTILGIGIAMGGYWAYVTLSFGGYWAWDPVENSSLVPWIIAIAGLHAMLIQKKSGSAQKASIFLAILAYMLVIYSTFLTRSGILGDISVHSFVDLGLYNQLLLWILSMGVVGFGLFAWRYRSLPRPKNTPETLSREFMIFCGAMILCAIGGVIIVGTSAPILGRIFRDNPAAVPIVFYNKWTLPLSIVLVFLAGLGQLFWWHKMNVERINRVLMKPVALAVASTVGILMPTPFVERTVMTGISGEIPRLAQAGIFQGVGGFWEAYGASLLLLLLVFAAFFALYGNGAVLWRVARGNLRMAGGALTHVGFALVILGIIASSGFSNILAPETLQEGDDRENFVITRNETRVVEGYRFQYVGSELTRKGRTRYLLDVTDPQGRHFRLTPVVYKTDDDQWIHHPDLQTYVEKDIYVAVRPRAEYMDVQEVSDSAEGGEVRLARGDSSAIGGGAYNLHFAGYEMNLDPELVPDSAAIAVGARLTITDTESGETRRLLPVYIIMQDQSQRYIQNRVGDWDLSVAFTGMNVDTGEITVAVQGVEVEPEDWLVVQAYEKPFINVLWMGLFLLFGGFGLAFYRRATDTHARRR